MTGRPACRRRGGVTVAALLAGVFAAWPPAVPAAKPRVTEVTAPTGLAIDAKPITSFDARDGGSRRFGALEFRGGLELTSTRKDFGGLSAIRVGPDGSGFLAITDKGNWLRGRITYRGEAPAGIADAELAPMLGADGRPLASRGWYDTESLAIDGGIAFVGIERTHQIVRFDIGAQGVLARGQAIPVPARFRTLPRNGGIEALVIIPKGPPARTGQLQAGTLLAISERGLDEAGNTLGFVIGGRRPGEFAVRRSDEFDITDAALLPGGDLVILERHFSMLRGVKMRLRRIAISSVLPGATVDGPVLMQADFGQQIDNMEGLSVHQAADGATVLTLVSDDNFSLLQRTLLLQFTLVDP